MAYNFSRRDFMKCAGVTVLAVASGSLLTGCGGSSDAGVYGVDKTATVAAAAGGSGSAKVTLKGYKDGWFSSLDAFASNITGTYAKTKWITVSLKIENNTNGDIVMGNTTESALKTLYNSLLTGDFKQLENIHDANFAMKCDGGKALFAAVGYKIKDNGDIDGYSAKLSKGESGFLKLYCIVPNSWGKMDILYTPPFNPDKHYTFRLSQDNDKKSNL